MEVRVAVSAPICNWHYLKQYLELSSYLSLYKNYGRRLMNKLQGWLSITSKTITLNIDDQVITILFSYDASIDLTKMYLQVSSSAAVGTPYLRYFYGSSNVTIDLSAPYNNLLTTYYSQ